MTGLLILMLIDALESFKIQHLLALHGILGRKDNYVGCNNNNNNYYSIRIE